jgi:hypothetical protein
MVYPSKGAPEEPACPGEVGVLAMDLAGVVIVGHRADLGTVDGWLVDVALLARPLPVGSDVVSARHYVCDPDTATLSRPATNRHRAATTT